MLTNTQIEDFITIYCKLHHITREKYNLYPVFLHLDGFSHSIGFTDHKVKKDEQVANYNSVGYSAYTNEVWGNLNEHQEKIACSILSQYPHYVYQHNPQEILF